MIKVIVENIYRSTLDNVEFESFGQLERTRYI